MQFVSGFSNPSQIDEISRAAVREAEFVDAAVAYVTETDTLIEHCVKLNVKLTLWARYDFSQPVSVPVIERFLNKASANFTLKFVPDIFHPKVIWWHGYGAYVGSANLTRSAWFGNVEAGLFLTEQELDEQDLRAELEKFFIQVDALSHPVRRELLDEINRFSYQDPFHARQVTEAEKRFEKERLIPRLPSLLSIDRLPRKQLQRDRFLEEWNSTLQLLRNIAERLADFRPSWIAPEVSKGAQVDQFLHAYYYQQVRDGSSHPYREFFQRHRLNPDRALIEAMHWWASLSSAPSQEDVMLEEWLPYLQDKLRDGNLLRLTRDEFAGVCLRVHAMRNHALRVSWKAYGLQSPLPSMNETERSQYFGAWLYDRQTSSGVGILDTIQFVLHGGPADKTPERIFQAAMDSKYRIEHLAISSLGELVGWFDPDRFPPRNNRTSKALVALGFDVEVHGD